MPGIVAYGSTFATSFLMSAGLPWPVLVVWALLVLLNVGLELPADRPPRVRGRLDLVLDHVRDLLRRTDPVRREACP